MKINEKVSQLKIIIQEIKNISIKTDNYNIYKSKIAELENEISRLKKGISESVDELEEFLGEEDARS
jgi:hypothetical protein